MHSGIDNWRGEVFIGSVFYALSRLRMLEPMIIMRGALGRHGTASLPQLHVNESSAFRAFSTFFLSWCHANNPPRRLT